MGRTLKREASSGPDVAVSWYRHEDYDLLKREFPDGDSLPATFDDWLRNVAMTRQQALAEGIRVKCPCVGPNSLCGRLRS